MTTTPTTYGTTDMIDTYGAIGCDGADEDLADLMSGCRFCLGEDDDDPTPLIGRIVDYFVMPVWVIALGMIGMAVTIGLAWVILHCTIDIWKHL